MDLFSNQLVIIDKILFFYSNLSYFNVHHIIEIAQNLYLFESVHIIFPKPMLLINRIF